MALGTRPWRRACARFGRGWYRIRARLAAPTCQRRSRQGLDGQRRSRRRFRLRTPCEPDLAGLARRWQEERVALLRRGAADARQLSVARSAELSLTSPLLHAGGRRLLSRLRHLPDAIARLDLAAAFPPGRARAAANP